MPYNKRKVYYIDGEWGGKICTECGWFRHWWEFSNQKACFKGIRPRCRKCDQKYHKEYYIEKRDDILEQKKEYHIDHREDRLKYRKKRYMEKRDAIINKQKEYYIEKRDDLLEQKKEYAIAPALFSTFGHQLTIEEQPRETENGYLEVKCANSACRDYFIPTNLQVQNRIKALNGGMGELRLYCSEKCKQECSLYRQQKYPKGFKTKPTGTEFPKFIRDKILERDNYKCQICGETHRLQAHHIYPGSTHPMLSNDVDNGITLCKKCHKKVHKLPGCGLHEIAACSQRIKQDLDDKGIDPHEIPDWAVEKYMKPNNNEYSLNE
jgi:hypothetical protein